MNLENEDASQRLLRLLSPLHERAVLTARRLSRSRSDGDDLFQEAALRALNRLSTLRDETRFRPWFFAILFTLHRQRHRRDLWRRFCSFDTVPEPFAKPTFHDEGADRIASALATLSAKEREALVLAELSGFQLEEIATLQSCSLSAVKSRVSRARARLRVRYLADEPEVVPFATKETP